MPPDFNPTHSNLAEGTRRRKLVAAMSENAEQAIAEFTRMLIEGEIDPDEQVRRNQEVFIEVVVTPKGLREAGYGT